MDIQKQADEIRGQILAQRAGEAPKDTAARWKKATEKRDKAIKKVVAYQDRTGIPSDREANDSFAVEAGLGESFADVEKHEEKEV